MPPKRGQKRKATGPANGDTHSNGDAPLAPPDRNTWPGWVEMESEPAFFNVMLKEMGVRGVQVQDVLDLQMLPAMPQPIHALIFLFRYKPQDEADNYTGSDQQHIWFANQVPSFACASVALLNIVNNIPGLTMGPELRNFKEFTKDMDPLTRGDAIDSFDFVRRIHNSFARESDLLNADMHLKNKFDQAKKKEAAAKGRATKAAKKAAKEGALTETSPNVTVKPERASGRTRKPTTKAPETPSSKVSTPKSGPIYSAESSPDPDGDDDAFEPGSRKKKTKAKTKAEPTTTAPTRRSARAPKPRNTEVYQSEAEEPEEGFHFIAYMPIGDHVWKLDGLDHYPHDMGSFGLGGNGSDGGTGSWLHVVAPTIENRMAQYAGADIEFNIMALVHDPAANARTDLLQNIKSLQTIDAKLDTVFEDWRDLDGAETKKDTITGISAEFEIVQPEVDAVEGDDDANITAAQEDFMELIKLRQKVIAKQAELRGALRMSRMTGDDDEEKARHRRHDYGSFVKKWMGVLAEQQVLGDLVEG